MTIQTRKKPKDRIIEVAANLFYGHDEHTIGVDKICAVADVSKRTLYKYFPSKEALVSAAITTLANAWAGEFINNDLENPLERITHVFKMLEKNAESADFHGCPMMNASIELRDSDALGIQVAKDFKSTLLNYFKQQAILLKAKNPDLLAEQLLLLYDGCNAWIVMRHTFPVSTFNTLSLLLESTG